MLGALTQNPGMRPPGGIPPVNMARASRPQSCTGCADVSLLCSKLSKTTQALGVSLLSFLPVNLAGVHSYSIRHGTDLLLPQSKPGAVEGCAALKRPCFQSQEKLSHGGAVALRLSLNQSLAGMLGTSAFASCKAAQYEPELWNHGSNTTRTERVSS